jgi:hypothetical protein
MQRSSDAVTLVIELKELEQLLEAGADWATVAGLSHVLCKIIVASLIINTCFRSQACSYRNRVAKDCRW